MPNHLPKIFVGCASEAIDLGEQFRTAIADVATGVMWKEAPEFEPTRSTLAGLLAACDLYDFGLFLLTPDDEIESRGIKNKCARDNVLVELGLFIGSLGRDRVFAVVKEPGKGETPVKAISDLDGIYIPRFKQGDEHETLASIAGAVRKIKTQIKHKGPVIVQFEKRSWGFSIQDMELHFSTSKDQILKFQNRLKNKGFLLVGRKQNPKLDFYNDPQVAISQLRKTPKHLAKNFTVSVKSKRFFSDVRQGDAVEFCLLLVPNEIEADIRKLKTISELVDCGCQISLDGGCPAT